MLSLRTIFSFAVTRHCYGANVMVQSNKIGRRLLFVLVYRFYFTLKSTKNSHLVVALIALTDKLSHFNQLEVIRFNYQLFCYLISCTITIVIKKYVLYYFSNPK